MERDTNSKEFRNTKELKRLVRKDEAFKYVEVVLTVQTFGGRKSRIRKA